MSHIIEPAVSGRAACRGCGRKIVKGELRFGERLPNPFADEGDMTLWFHPVCGAFKRPEAFLEALDTTEAVVEASDELRAEAARSIEHRRLPRIDGADRAPTARATCRACREKIPKDDWRIKLVYFESERFTPSGFIHLRCAEEYFGTRDILDRLRHFSPDLDASQQAELSDALD